MSAAEESSQIRSGLTDQLPDKDPQETSEWIESLDGLIEERGTERAQYIMRSLMQRASAQAVALVMLLDAAALAPGEPVDGTRVAHALIAAAVTVVVHLLAGRRTLVSIASGTLDYVLLVNLA